MAATTPTSITKPTRQKSVAKKPIFDPLGASLVRANEMDWIGTHAGVKMLRISQETGWIAALVRGRAGQVNPPHTHLGPACFYVIEGGFEFRGGSAQAGDWVWEPAGAVHPATSHPVRYGVSFEYLRSGDVP
jgi:anti-sigma factor ChrR (cupin superfamily)